MPGVADPQCSRAMNPISQKVMRAWADMGPGFLPFADAATADVPLSRLLRLSLFQVSVGMAMVLIVGTLNRVMIVELGVAASVVAVMISLPVLYAPFRTLVGFRSDTHRSALGWKRVPFIWMGTMLQFGGLAIMPFALLVLSGGGNAAAWPSWIGPLCAGLAFLLVGAGLHTIQTAGLALATDLVPAESRPTVVGLMYVMLLLGTVVSAVIFGVLLVDFSPGRLVQVIQGAAVTTIVLNIVALWKQETRRPPRNNGAASAPRPSFREAWGRFIAGDHAMRRLVAIVLGTMAFTMQDVLLEPYGGQVLGMTVAQTTLLTATLAAGGLFGFAFASRTLSRGADPLRMAVAAALVGMPAFGIVILAGPLQSLPLFVGGVFLLGFGSGVFGHGTLTASMSLAPRDQIGLALGAWGAAQATAAGVGVALGGIIRDLVAALAGRDMLGPALTGPATGYTAVYCIEIALLLATVVVMLPLVGGKRNVSFAGS
jgi:BCD family chlorophyll transporter-like MFS transporter